MYGTSIFSSHLQWCTCVSTTRASRAEANIILIKWQLCNNPGNIKSKTSKLFPFLNFLDWGAYCVVSGPGTVMNQTFGKPLKCWCIMAEDSRVLSPLTTICFRHNVCYISDFGVCKKQGGQFNWCKTHWILKIDYFSRVINSLKGEKHPFISSSEWTLQTHPRLFCFVFKDFENTTWVTIIFNMEPDFVIFSPACSF